ncbi:hypothetical protein LguiA_013829 [Lonicera macranthoides]
MEKEIHQWRWRMRETGGGDGDDGNNSRDRSLKLEHGNKEKNGVFITILIVFLFFFATVSHSQKLKTFTRNYGPFTSFDFSRLNVQPFATISNDALQLTPDTANSPGVFDTANKSGRVLLPRQFKLFLQSNTSRIASFNSSFLINISPPRNSTSKGEGLAFVIVPNPDVPVDSHGEYLGLTNSSLNGNFRQDSLRLKSPT